VTAPGSPAPLAAFARFCRSEIDAVIGGDEMPSLLFAHGPDFPVPLTLGWQLLGERPDNEELIDQLLPAWIDQTGASQVAIAVPFGRPRPGTTMVALDELESLLERSYVDIPRLRLGDLIGRSVIAKLSSPPAAARINLTLVNQFGLNQSTSVDDATHLDNKRLRGPGEPECGR
jgi:hypothetical protein